MAYNKIIYGESVLIDLTGDTVTEEALLSGYTAHGADGEVVTGACDFDVNSQDATAAAADLLSGKTAYAKGQKLTGAMVNRGAVSGTLATKDGAYAIPQGYHNGSGAVTLSPTEQAKLVAGNIKAGVTLLGVTGDYSGNTITAQQKTVTPSNVQQQVTPDAGYDYLSQVTVAAIPYAEQANGAGGITVTIG